MKPKISIIVPVYKVEPFIHKCVDSILAQTFTEFELILVNDGSPDNCGTICDEYTKKDRRVKVIHKDNGGQASARNRGLEIAGGEYIGFVDSDDWIEPDMYELLYNMCIQNNCDIANCTYKIHAKHNVIIKASYPLMIHDRNQAMKAMLEDELYNEVVWSKLFKRNLLENIRFPEGIMYEDTAFTYKVIHRSNKVCCLGEPKYHYIIRENSTMDRAAKSKSVDAVLIYDEMNRFIAQHYKELIDLISLKFANSAMLVLNSIAISGVFPKHKHDYYKVSKILNSHFYKTIKLPYYNKNVKLLLLAAKIHPLLYKFIVNKLFRRNGI
ncbi:glycosyl transferase family protein [Neobacillus bataviensis LMG 21833]|uniref:Glycosyl transferase family protein n=1 Tax=Neobacillus bataviensis LMG 21833 TaxID=1117379 RepID=K6DA26_9BACI|nr:glycosyltransferase [Neobacillus bataviensis]EKN69392.1 glycosyl transferase family protein [Neobacillus bataviensis LMG 21833]